MEYNEDLSHSPKKPGKLCYSFIPARVIFIMLGFQGFCLIYAFRVVLSVAIVAMVGQTNTTNYSEDCPVDNITKTEEIIGEFYDWSSDRQAIILGAFFYGYVITQIPGGILAVKFGAKWIFGISLLITALLSLLGPFAARWGFWAFFLTRLGQGLAEGVVWPCMHCMISKWMPEMERSRGATIIYSGSQIGTVISLPIAGYLCDGDFMGGWPSVFYLIGILGCVWFIFWSALVYESPDKHPYISEDEYEFIKSGQHIDQTNKASIIPWKSILKSQPVYALILTHFGQNWGFLTVLTLLPTYFSQILHMDITESGLMSSLPYLLQAVIAWIASMISDKVRQTGKVSVTTIRKVNNSIAFLSPALCLFGVTFSKCDTTLSIVFFTLAMGLNGCCYSGFNSTHVDMAPDFSGTLMGLTNTIGNLPGFIAPIVANAITENGNNLMNWSYVFYISMGVYIISALIYMFFASANLQPWGVVGRASIFSMDTLRNNVITDPNINFDYIRRISSAHNNIEHCEHCDD